MDLYSVNQILKTRLLKKQELISTPKFTVTCTNVDHPQTYKSDLNRIKPLQMTKISVTFVISKTIYPVFMNCALTCIIQF